MKTSSHPMGIPEGATEMGSQAAQPGLQILTVRRAYLSRASEPVPPSRALRPVGWQHLLLYKHMNL